MGLIADILLGAVLVYTGICVLYFLFQEKFIFVPSWPHESFESSLTVPVEQFHLSTPHRGKIHAIHLKPANPRGIILYFHGNTGTLRRWQFMAEELALRGFEVVAMDYRGYGLSQGPRREAWMHRDAEAVWDHVEGWGSGLPLIIYGRSLGTGFATRLASRRKASGLVLETPFANLVHVASFYLPMLPVRFLLRYRLASDEHIRKVECPILILHGTRDLVVPHSSALRLFRAADGRSSVRMVTIVGGKHSNLNSFPIFHEHLGEFLDEAANANRNPSRGLK
ncbi:MAG: alpha/beta hydrolase [Flavobacteriales bacterium]|jgi:alpha-beta hydrolase superfamily lysophospholipase